MKERIILLVRHGQLDMQAFAAVRSAAGLTARGRAQARCTARRLRELLREHLREFPVKSIYSSTLGRAKETADIIAAEFPGVPVRPSRLLWELPNFEPAGDRARRRVLTRRRQRGERAFQRFVRPAARTGEVSILVSHGNLIRYFVCRVLGIPPESWSVLGSHHCGVTELVVSNEAVCLTFYNDTLHLPHRLHAATYPAARPAAAVTRPSKELRTRAKMK